MSEIEGLAVARGHRVSVAIPKRGHPEFMRSDSKSIGD